MTFSVTPNTGDIAVRRSPETIAELIQNLDRLRAQKAKWEAEGAALAEQVIEAQQGISRAIKVLSEAITETTGSAPA